MNRWLRWVFCGLVWGGCFVSLLWAQEPKAPYILGASDEGENAITSFKVPEGLSCKLFAAEPDLANPVAIFVDYRGRVYVCETFRQGKGVTDNRNHDLEWTIADVASKTVQDRIDYHRRLLPDGGASYIVEDDRIRRLVDKDRDGVVDESVVFASGFQQLEDGTGAGVLAYRDSVFYTCIPKLWELKDSDQDGRSDSRRVIADGFGVRVALRGHDMHGLTIGPDGRLYFSIGDRGYDVHFGDAHFSDPASGAVFRCELDGTNLERFATGLRNPQELAFDDWGRLFTGDNNSDSGDKARWVYVVPGGDTGWRMYYQYHPTRGPFNRESIWQPYHDRTPAYIIPPIANVGDGPSGLTYYPGTGLGDRYRGTFFLCDFRGQASNSGIRALRVEEEGAFFKMAEDSKWMWNILATDVDFGPDGGVYVADWINGWGGEGKGRIYRMMDPAESEAAASTFEWLNRNFDALDLPTLESLLRHADRRVRCEAQWALASREAIGSLVAVANQSDLEAMYRLHGVWGLGQIARKGRGGSAAALQALRGQVASDSDRVRATAILMLAEAKDGESEGLILAGMEDASVHVQVQAALAIGAMQWDSGMEAVCGLLAKNQDRDPIVRHAGIMGLAGQRDLQRVVDLAAHSSKSVRRAAVVALRKRVHPGISRFLGDLDVAVAAEAARAIYDVVALESEMPKLAATLELASRDLEWQRRAMAAHYRLGGKANVAALVQFAAEERSVEELRLEALRCLKEWKQPNVLDRVTGDYRPIAERGLDDVQAEMKRELSSFTGASKEVRALALEVAASLGIDDVKPMLVQVLEDTKASGKHRASALTGLTLIDVEMATRAAEQYAGDSSSELKIAALKWLVEQSPEKSIAALERLTQAEVVQERQAGWDMLAKLKGEVGLGVVERGAKDYLARKLPGDVQLNVYEAVEARLKDPGEDWRTLQESRRIAKEENRLEAYEDCLDGGSMYAGKYLFFERANLSCVRCHRVGEKGGEVGPLLTEIAVKKDAKYLLEAIVDPNRQIAEGFESTVVVTDEGEILTGIVKKEDADSLQLMNADGEMVTVATDTIEARKKGLSSMPADLVKQLTARELRDLVAYLRALDGKTPGVLPATGH